MADASAQNPGEGVPGSYFERVAPDSYHPTSHAEGAWNPGEIHFGPLSGLIVHTMDRHRVALGANSKLLGRVSFDILGFLAAEDCVIRVETIRPGRTIELIQATVTIAGRIAVNARAWYLNELDTTAVAGGASPALESPDGLPQVKLGDKWSGGYVASIDVRPVGTPQPGRASVWVRSAVALVAGEDSSAHATFISQVDVANGVATRQPPGEWIFPNVDLTIHLFRQPRGDWTGLDVTVIFGPTGLGLTHTELHDVEGPVGAAEQLLTVRPAVH